MELGTKSSLTGFILCAAYITFLSQASAAIKDHHFLILNIRANDSLGCYRRAKGFPSTPYKGQLSRVIGLAPTDVNTWPGKDKLSRYSLCLSVLKGFQNSLPTVLTTEKNQPDFSCAGLLPVKLPGKLNILYQRLTDTVDALMYYQSGIKLSGVKSLDMTMVLKAAVKAAKTWPPATKDKPCGTNPQFLVNYVILDQLKDTVQSLMQHNVCPVPYS